MDVEEGGGRRGRKEEGGRRKEEGGRRKEEGGRRKEEGGRRRRREGGAKSLPLRRTLFHLSKILSSLYAS
jgi:ATP-dependent RNA helicase DHX57